MIEAAEEPFRSLREGISDQQAVEIRTVVGDDKVSQFMQQHVVEDEVGNIAQAI